MSAYNLSYSYREVIPDLSISEEWTEISLNTGGAHSTLQDITVAEKAGGYCYQNVTLNHNRNRFIQWRSYKDMLELTETSLDFNLYQNKLRYRFNDSPVLSVSIAEHDQRSLTVLVITVCSLHRLSFPHPDSLADGSGNGSSGGSCNSSSAGGSIDFNEAQTFSIFRESSAANGRDPATFYTINMAQNMPSTMPHAACSFLASNSVHAYFALAFQTQLLVYQMHCGTGETTTYQLKEQHKMPRFFSNIKGALIGRINTSDAENASSVVFVEICNKVYLVALYRDDHLRLWCATTAHCITTINCVRDANVPRLQGPQSSSLRKINNNSICAFLSHSTGAEFVCIDIQLDPITNSLIFVHRKIITAPKLDLADFDVSATRIWALWCNAEGDFSISNFPLQRGVSLKWVSAAMEPPPDRYCVGLEQGMDPRQAYCAYIFHPGKFDRSVISKAFFMFRRSNVRFEDKFCSLSLLKEQVCQAVDNELQNEIKDFEATDDDYLEISTRLWERFYSCCEQYHMKASQPIGLVLLQSMDAVCVIKKNNFSLLRPCELLEHLMLAGESAETSDIVSTHFQDNQAVGADFVNLIGIMSQIERWLPEDVKLDLDKKLYSLSMPAHLIEKLAEEMLSTNADREILPRNFLTTLQQQTAKIANFNTVVKMLMNHLCMDHGNPEDMRAHLNLVESSRFLMSVGILFGSNVGLSLLSDTIRQTCLIGYAICRNLLIYLHIVIVMKWLPKAETETLRSNFMPEIIIFLQSYYAMVWICETPVDTHAAAALENSVQRLSLLQLTNGSGRIYSHAKASWAPLLRIFLHAKGLYTALSLYAQNFKGTNELQISWHNTLLPLSTIITQLIWPISCNFIFGEWLFGTCQHILIQEYVRLLHDWCEWNACSRQFMRAVSLLDCGQTVKAYNTFLQAAKGVLKESFLSNKILKDSCLSDSQEYCLLYNEAIAQYSLKVIQLFEQHNARDHIIDMANMAIGLLAQTDPLLPMFQSIVFNNHLFLEHYEEAYNSLISNAESPRRKDCLRQLVITLFEKKRLDLLIHFPYIGLHKEFESIVESSARSLAIENNDVYDFLYAFHVNTGNMRKASAVMYEKAMRLLQDSGTFESMQQRYSALLVCINALNLVDKRYRWIARPIIKEEQTLVQSQALERCSDNAMEFEYVSDKNPVIVLEIEDIRKEVLQTQALITLAQHRKDSNSYVNAGPLELASILANSLLFTDALRLAKGFNLALTSVFESLTAACVRAAENNSNDAWSWLQANDLADLPHCKSAADMAWALLEKLVEDNEQGRSTCVRKVVVNKLLSLNAFVPQWLQNSYKLANASELLLLYVKHNRLLEGAQLATEFINAMLGAGNEYFHFKHAISVVNPPMCFPINTVDLLLQGLKLNEEDDLEYQQAAIDLEVLIKKYIQTATRTEEDKIQISLPVSKNRN